MVDTTPKTEPTWVVQISHLYPFHFPTPVNASTFQFITFLINYAMVTQGPIHYFSHNASD